jgi:Nuclease-related domain
MLNLRRNDVCCRCGCSLAVGSWARWDATARTVTCAACLGVGARASESIAEPTPESRAEPTPERMDPELDRGQPGASVAREYRRRRQNRETRTRAAHPRIGGLLLALGGSPQRESAFHQGELGELAVASYLEKRLRGRSAILLHDRRMPRGRGNIDHLAVAPTGVYVIDAKNLHGKVSVAKPLFGAAKLLVDGDDRTKLIDGLDRQVRVVRDALAASAHPDVRLQGVLCFTSSADLPLLGTLKMREHLLLHHRRLAKRLSKTGELQAPEIDALAHSLAVSLPSA